MMFFLQGNFLQFLTVLVRTEGERGHRFEFQGTQSMKLQIQTV